MLPHKEIYYSEIIFKKNFLNKIRHSFYLTFMGWMSLKQHFRIPKQVCVIKFHQLSEIQTCFRKPVEILMDPPMQCVSTF